VIGEGGRQAVCAMHVVRTGSAKCACCTQDGHADA
jgi:hypothetical protein